ncbi:MAG TPA: hypothetical protein VGM39_14860 [Kofleriaceae bacterium]|jgi:hypothetical protein
MKLIPLLFLAACGSSSSNDIDASVGDAPHDTAGSDAATDGPAGGRNTTDQPDEAQGYQVHAIYAIASDGTDRNYDTDGHIANSVAAWNKWFGTASGDGRKFRLDTYNGALDITFARLPETEAQLSAQGAFIRDHIENDLQAGGQIKATKIYAVYYDGPTTFSCGGGAFPPTLIGHVGAFYLKGAIPSAPTCDSNPWAGPNGTPGYREFAMIHELFHVIGAAPICAPHQVTDMNGHTSDGATDLMYAGNLPWNPSQLDIGHDDYFDTTSSTCLDVADSVFIDPLPANAKKPPGWP